MTRKKIAACFIAGDNETAENISRLVKSLGAYVDAIYVGYTGSHPTKSISWRDALDDAKTIVVIDRIPWEDDFSKARNANFAIVNRDRYDWILWCDSDDELVGGDKLQDVLSSVDKDSQVVFMRYLYAFNSKTGEELVNQMRERMFRTDVKTRWEGIVHEVCRTPPATLMSKRYRDDCYFKHWKDFVHGDNTASRVRNRAMLERAIEEFPSEGRYRLYLAHETFSEAEITRSIGKFAEAYKLYDEYVTHFGSASGDDPYQANCRMAECLRIMSRWNEAIDRDLQGIKLRPSYPESYLGIAESMLGAGNYELAVEWADMCMDNNRREDTFNATESQQLEYAPHWYKAQAYEQLGRYEDAMEEYDHCRSMSPYLNDLDAKITEMAEANKRSLKADKARKRLMDSRKSKSIAFVTTPHFEPWHPEIAKMEGCGGAETCVMEVAKRFAEDGYRSVVFGTPGSYRGVAEDGVEYWDTGQDLQSSERFDTVVCSRSHELLDVEWNTDQTLLWMHDVNIGPVPEDRWDAADAVICLTDWHAKHVGKIYGLPAERFVKVPNGFDPTKFTTGEKEPHSFVYASSPDRGVEIVLALWPEIKKMYPDATLDVFYGWTGIDKLLKLMPGHNIRVFKDKVLRILDAVNEDGSVRWHNRVPHDVLAASYATTAVWLYPTPFLETACITSFEMQASGVIPATSNNGALKESVACPELRIEGYPNNFDFQRRYLDHVRMIVEIEDAHEDWRSRGAEHASKFTWDAAYQTWRNLVGISPTVSVAMS